MPTRTLATPPKEPANRSMQPVRNTLLLLPFSILTREMKDEKHSQGSEEREYQRQLITSLPLIRSAYLHEKITSGTGIRLPICVVVQGTDSYLHSLHHHHHHHHHYVHLLLLFLIIIFLSLHPEGLFTRRRLMYPL